ncbi:hypothetical protein, partial [Mycobacterium kansasii]|uniref:hypothetical protein n=1 Tax=Mycobacterium kansasii TaxID=1768 RepID=UPI003AAFBC14
MKDCVAGTHGHWYCYGYATVDMRWDCGDGDAVRDADQALVVAAPEQAVAVAAGNERSGVDIAAVCHTGV